jgi:hypothetical protein
MGFDYVCTAYQYTLKFRKRSENIPADVLSRLPLTQSISHSINYCDFIPSCIPINYLEVAEETKKDPILIKVKALTLTGWPDANLTPFWSRRHELTSEKYCIIWGNRVVIPTNYRHQSLLYFIPTTQVCQR